MPARPYPHSRHAVGDAEIEMGRCLIVVRCGLPDLCVVVADIVMADIVMAYVVMAYVVMA